MKTNKERLEYIIPGGAHTYSRGLEIYPTNVPDLLVKGKGAYTWSQNGKKYLDYSMALRSVILGYADNEVNRAVINAIENGNTFSRPSLIELEAAEMLVSKVKGADMVKFAKNGSNVTTAAIKLARAFTGRDIVIHPEEQPFFSFDDWFISNTKMNYGSVNDGLTKKFKYGDVDSLKALFSKYKGQIACVIMEPATHLNPCSCESSAWLPNPSSSCCQKDNSLHEIRKICDKDGVVLIFDEMITGHRWSVNGAQAYFGVIPDLSTFGKAIANGFSIAALAGKREIMDFGGTNVPEKERVFLLSSTHGAETTSLAALIKTTEIIERENVSSHIWDYNNELVNGINNAISEFNLNDYFSISGNAFSPMINYHNNEKYLSNDLKYVFLKELMDNGIIMPWIATSLAHNEKTMAITLETIRKVFHKIDSSKSIMTEGKLKQIFRFKN